MDSVLDQCDSTNNWLKEKFKTDASAKSGNWISARVQSAGKGRQGREWVGTEGSLFLSIGFKAVPQEKLTWIPLVTGMAIARALEPWVGSRALRIKWPNDLILDHDKLGGILCESWSAGQGADVIVGIGINGVASPQGIDQGTAALGVGADQFREASRLAVTRDVLAWIAGSISIPALQKKFNSLAYLPEGSFVSWAQNQGRVLGLGDSGELRVQKNSPTGEGEITAVHSDDIKGLRALQFDTEWKQKLSPLEYQVLRLKGTERPFTGQFDHHFEEGQYLCRGCDAQLFDSTSKFDSGCGWPAFDSEVAGAPVVRQTDDTHGMKRTEILCARCGGHLGHVFDDGPTQTGERYCVNSASIQFKGKK